MCLALWKIILVGMMLGFATCLPAPPPLAESSEGVAGAVDSTVTSTGGRGTVTGPEGETADLNTANTFGFGYGVGLGSLYSGYYGGGYNRGYYGGGYRGFGYGGYPSYYGGYPSYYGGFW